MTTPHRATPSDWAWLEGNSTCDRCDAAWSRGLIELRARIEKLELASENKDDLLAQPEPQGPSDEELLELLSRASGLPEPDSYIVDGGRIMAEPGEILSFARAVLARFARPAIEPVPVSERLPEPHTKVIAHYLNDLGNSRTILAEWVPAKSRTDDCLVDDDFAEYDEEADEYYWPEGWYESIENWDDYGAVFVHEGMITHWQPLPPRPHHALPVPQQEVK
jgi:hypothetical protein